MKCPKTGFTALKIATLIVTGIALVVHIAAVSYPVWDKIDVSWGPWKKSKPMWLKLQASGSLWHFTKKVDDTHLFFPPVPNLRNTAWKEPIKLMELTAIGMAVMSMLLSIISEFVDRCKNINYVFLLFTKMLPIAALYCTSSAVISGTLLYKYQYTRSASNNVFNPNFGLPIDKFVLWIGWNLECAAGALFILASLIAITDSIHRSISKDGTTSASVVPFEK